MVGLKVSIFVYRCMDIMWMLLVVVRVRCLMMTKLGWFVFHNVRIMSNIWMGNIMHRVCMSYFVEIMSNIMYWVSIGDIMHRVCWMCQFVDVVSKILLCVWNIRISIVICVMR